MQRRPLSLATVTGLSALLATVAAGCSSSSGTNDSHGDGSTMTTGNDAETKHTDGGKDAASTISEAGTPDAVGTPDASTGDSTVSGMDEGGTKDGGGGAEGGGNAEGGSKADAAEGGSAVDAAKDSGSGPLTSTCKPADVFAEPWVLAAGVDLSRDYFVGDVNNDGLPDFVSLATTSGMPFEIIVNKGNGVFAAAVEYPGPEVNGEGITLGDINGDGYLDVIYGTFFSGSSSEAGIAVALNNKNGTFGVPVTYDTGENEALNIRALDLNHDGKIDLFFSSQEGSSSYNVMLNTAGTLGPVTGVTLDGGGIGHSFEFADLDGDGNVDVAAYSGTAGFCYALGLGNGSFKPEVCANGPTDILEIESIAIGDVNGDKKPDVVLFNYSTNTEAGVVFLNSGTGSLFGTYSDVASPDGGIYDGQLADMNNDGKLDVLFFDDVTTQLLVAYGNGDGTFRARPEVLSLGSASGASGASIIVADYLHDGLPGVAYVNLDAPGFTVLPQTCRTTIPAAASILPPSTIPKSTCVPAKVSLGAVQQTSITGYQGASAAADLDGDGKYDLVVVGGSTSTAGFSFELSNGDGTFKTAVAVPESRFAQFGTALAVGDVNGDGKADVLYSAQDSFSEPGVAVALNAGGGNFSPAVFSTSFSLAGGSEPSVITVADVNNDGHLDVFIDAILLLGNGDGTFGGLGYDTGIDLLTTGNPFRLVDLDGDGQLDLVELNNAGDNATGGFCSQLNVGNANFGAANCAQALTSDTPTAVAVGDLNGDGKADVVVAYDTGVEGIDVFLGKGDGTFNDGKNYVLPSDNAYLVELDDLNNDGKLDLLVWYDYGNQFQVFLGAGDGTFATTGQTFGAGVESLSLDIAIGDFAGNGLRGFAVANNARPGVDVVLATCSP